jgi:hypothetical protein
MVAIARTLGLREYEQPKVRLCRAFVFAKE